MSCPCGHSPCRRLASPNVGEPWLFAATATMPSGEAMAFRAAHAHREERRGLVPMALAATEILFTQQPHLFAKAKP